MRAQIIALAAAAAAIVPVAASAQAVNRNADNDLKMRQQQEQLRQYQQQTPAQAQAEQRLERLDQQVRTQQNIANITPPPGPTLQPVDIDPTLITGGIDLAAQSALMNKELAAETARLKAGNP